MHVFASACSVTGRTMYFLATSDTRRLYDNDDAYLFLCDLKIPEVTHEDIQNLLLGTVNSEISRKQDELKNLFNKKQQLLAITHQE